MIKKIFLILVVLTLVLAGIGYWQWRTNRGTVVTLVAKKAIDYLPTPDGQEAQMRAITTLAKSFLTDDGRTHRIFLMLQNNMELRPSGGFLGQYAVIEIRDGQIVGRAFEDANILDQRIDTQDVPPAQLAQYGEIKKWKFRDSNWSPDFPESVDKALYFYQAGGGNPDMDAVVAVNATMLNDLLAITGPITLEGKNYEGVGEFNKDNALTKLQDVVERVFIRDEVIKKAKKEAAALGIEYKTPRDENGKRIMKVSNAERQFRKNIIGDLIAVIEDRLMDPAKMRETVPALVGFGLNGLAHKDIQVWMKDSTLQETARAQKWTGEVDRSWSGDYLMVVDANLGALKSDYYVKRSIEHTVDFRGMGAAKNAGSSAAKVAATPGQRMVRYRTPELQAAIMGGTYRAPGPLATTRVTYQHTATAPDWRTSDYHAFTRMIVPAGATNWITREWFPVPQITEEWGRAVYGYKFDLIIGDTMPLMLQYILPPTITEDNYAFKIQKQSGTGAVPLTLQVITKDGTTYEYTATIDHDREIRLADMTKK